MNKSTHILLIDFFNIFYAHFYANKSVNIDGLQSGAITGFLKKLYFLIEETSADKVYIIMEGENGSIRKRQLFAEYKEGRKPKNTSKNYLSNDYFFINSEKDYKKIINTQITKLLEILSKLPITIIKIDNLEADDVIGYFVKTNKDDNITIASNDKDFWQLLCFKNIKVLNHQKMKYVDDKEIFNHFCCSKCNVKLVKSILGDPSDNIEKIGNKIGKKTLYKMFPFINENKEYDIDTIEKFSLSYIDELKKENTKKSLKEITKYKTILSGLDKINLNYKLIDLSNIEFLISDRQKKELEYILNNEELKFSEFELLYMLDLDLLKIGMDESIFCECFNRLYIRNKFIK